MVEIAGREGLAPGLKPLSGGVALHIACHARAQNIGQKAAEMLRLIPDPDLQVIERCSGHGGAWGVMKGNFEIALKVGRPVARQALQSGKAHRRLRMPAGRPTISCRAWSGSPTAPPSPHDPQHPIQLFAKAYGLM